MFSITKFLGVLIVFFGVVLLMTCFDSTDRDPLDVVAIGFVGLLVTAMGVIFWIWDEPYNEEQD